MSDPLPQGQPAWVRKRDGSLVPFEADKISRALFAATEGLGRPDAFLARELTDGVVHFLADESGAGTPSTAEIAELVVKTVRELGQPLLARVFEEYRNSRERQPAQAAPARPRQAASPARSRDIELRFALDTPLVDVLAECTRSYTLQAVFARDVVSIHDDGLLTLTGLDTPGELAGDVLPGLAPAEWHGQETVPQHGGLVEALQQLRQHTGQVAVLDGPEHHLARAGQVGAAVVAELVRELEYGLQLTGLRSVVNLNGVLPPSSVDDLAGGPLFAGQRWTPAPEALAELSDALLDRLVRSPLAPDRLRIDWHLSERDFAPGRSRERLLRLARLMGDGAAVACVFDRPRRPVPLAEGINRQHPAVLLQVGLHLPRLAVQTGTTADTGRFLQKLGSLARLALSAGVQKRAYLRRRGGGSFPHPHEAAAPALTRGFLLDRARLLVTPVGLDAVVRTLTGRGLCAGGAALDLGRQIVQRLRDVLRQDGRASRLETCLDGPARFRLGGPATEESEAAAGLTPWEPAAGLKNQWRAAGVLHGVTEQGTLALFGPAPEGGDEEQAAEWLQAIWQQTEVVRVRLLSSASSSLAASASERGRAR